MIKQKTPTHTSNQQSQCIGLLHNLEKITFSILFKQLPLIFLKNPIQLHTFVYVPTSLAFFLSCHYRLSESFFAPNLIDIFGYEIPAKTSNKPLLTNEKKLSTVERLNSNNNVLVFVYYFFKNAKCVFNLTKVVNSNIIKKKHYLVQKIVSLEFFFKNAIWLERELREMLGVAFTFKTDNRCLLLLYGSSDFPLKKLFPTQGRKTLYYDSSDNSIKHEALNAQY